MPDKEEILKILKKSLYWEEDFMAKYDSKSIWVLLQSLPKEKFQRIKKLLRQNIDESEKHHDIIKSIVEKIKSGEYEP